MSSKDNNEDRVMHLRSDKIELMNNNKKNEVIEERFQSLPSRYQIGQETSMKCSDFIFDYINLLQYKCLRINFKRGGSFPDSTDWIKNKKGTINRINKKR